jgi:hypothetical protein
MEDVTLMVKSATEKLAGIEAKLATTLNENADMKKAFEQHKEDLKSVATTAQLEEKMSEFQKQFDDLATKQKTQAPSKKSFGEAFADSIENEFDAIQKSVSRGQKHKFQVKAVGNMTVGGNLTGDSVVNYGRNAILPSTLVNFRDLIPTSNSSTLVQAYYRETAGEGGIAVQTEGSAKGQIDFDFSEIKTVNKYVAGFVRFSKQMTMALPWMQSTLPRLLLREFYSGATGENATFFGAVNAAATGSTTTAETDDVKQIIDYIANQRTAKFAASYGLISHTQLARLNKLTYTNGYYSGSGGVLTNVDGSMTISGMPVIPVDWVTDDKILVVDRDYLERVEAQGITIELFEQDSDNVQKNLITARIECLEEINLMLPQSAIYADLGNVI